MIEMNREIIRGKDIDKKWNEVKKAIVLSKHRSSTANAAINDTVFSYDSETTNYVDKDGNKKPFVFSLMLTILNPETNYNVNILSRSIDEYRNAMNTITNYVGCKVAKELRYDKKGMPVMDDLGNPEYDDSKNTYIDVFVHNLAFDASFLISHQDVYTMFASSAHKPYYYITMNGVRYKDTAVLTQKKLEQLGKELTKFDVHKMVGDFDYNKIRNGHTPFNKKERGYVVNDTLVLAAYIAEELETYKYVCYMPLTMTGIVRAFARSAMNGDLKTYKEFDRVGVLPKDSKLHKLLNLNKMTREETTYASNLAKEMAGNSGRSLKLTLGKYQEMERAYTGGFTHSNPYRTTKINRNVQSWDFTSSYPTRMVSEKYVINDGYRVPVDDLEDKLKRAEKDNKLYMFDVSFSKIESNVDFDYYLSVSKCECDKDNLIESNGRVVCATDVKTTMLSTDWETFSKVYDMSGTKFSNVWCFDLGYLPLGLVMSTLYFYKQKTKLKGIVGEEKNYRRSKARLNSLYGMCCLSVLRTISSYSNEKGWEDYKTDDMSKEMLEKKIDEYNNSKSRFLYYMWGVQISSYSRRELWRGILECGNDYVYSDTDSIKVINADKHKKFIDEYNAEIVDKINACLDYYHLDHELACPVDIKGNEHQLGVWDPNDGFYSYFKTLGAKRYIDISKSNNVFEITIAGLSKKLGAKYMLDQCKIKYKETDEGYQITANNNGIKRLFDYFNDGLYVPAGKTGKLARYYVDHYEGFKVTDFQGNEEWITDGSGCLLQATDFTLSMSEQFATFLNNLLDGYVKLDNLSGYML